MESKEEMTNKLKERQEYFEKQVLACEEKCSYYSGRGRFPLAAAWKKDAEYFREVVQEIAKRLEA